MPNKYPYSVCPFDLPPLQRYHLHYRKGLAEKEAYGGNAPQRAQRTMPAFLMTPGLHSLGVVFYVIQHFHLDTEDVRLRSAST
jgi:hypothetical protein